MARTVRWSETATLDLEEAADFIDRDSRYYAAALVRDARAAARSLRTLAERQPGAGQSHRGALEGKKYTFILGKPYRWEEWAAPKTKNGQIDHNKTEPGASRHLFRYSGEGATATNRLSLLLGAPTCTAIDEYGHIRIHCVLSHLIASGFAHLSAAGAWAL